MGAAFARERDSGRGADEDEAASPSRWSRRCPRAHASRRGRTGCRTGKRRSRWKSQVRPSWPSRSTRFISAMPISMCWPSGMTRHFSGESVHLVVDRLRLGAPHAGLVDEAAQVGGDGDVGRDGDESLPDAGDAGELEQRAAEGRLGGDAAGSRGRKHARDGHRRGGRAARRGRAVLERAARTRPSAVSGSNLSHSVSAVNPTSERSRSICLPSSRAEWFCGRPAISRP